MDELGPWLHSIGLGQLEQLFAAHDVDFEILRDLTESDLAELGLSLGQRKRLLKALDAFSAAGDVASGQPDGRPSRLTDAERRQMTVMFCDLAGFTAISERFDPEDVHHMLTAYQDVCAGVIRRYEGHIARYLGDGILVYFGYPAAHENDAERALRAGLDMLVGIETLNLTLAQRHGIKLAVRIGVHTGLVVAGEIGAGAMRERHGVVGTTPNIAFRLQEAAEPNTLVTSGDTHRLVEGLFECVDWGPRRYKGISDPVQTFRVLRRTDVPSRFEATARRGLSPIVGRDEELGLLRKRWRSVRDGKGQVVLLSGEAGVGKSRIVRAFREGLGDEPRAESRLYCSPYHRHSAFHPILEHLALWLKFDPGDTAAQKRGKLESGLAGLNVAAEDAAPALASFLTTPSDPGFQPIKIEPPQIKRAMLKTLLSIVRALASDSPYLMVVEDVQWADPSTLEFLSAMVEIAPSLRLLLLLVYRPDFESPWTARADVTALPLARLSQAESAAMVEHILGGRTLPVQVSKDIVAKTDGMPLFIEEITRAVVEASDRTGPEATTFADGGSIGIPSTIQDSLMARLDRMVDAKEVAQLAAVLGRGFTSDLLGAVSPLPADGLRRELAKLVESGLVYRSGRRSNTYTFKHALVHEVAYQSLLKSTRQHYHERVASVLAREFRHIGDAEPELMAHHLTEAGRTREAIPYWIQAAERAAEHSANLESIAQFERALSLIENLPDTEDRSRQEFRCRLGMISPLMAAKGYSAPEVERTVARAFDLAKRIGNSPEMFPVLYGQYAFNQVSGRIAKSLALGEQFMELASRQNDDTPRMVAHRLLGASKLLLGRPAAARHHLEQTTAAYDQKRHRALASLYGQDIRVAGLGYLCLDLWYAGYFEQAQRCAREALDHARTLGHANSLGVAHAFAGAFLQCLCRNAGDMERHALELLTLGTQQKLPVWRATGQFFLGLALTWQGRPVEGFPAIREGLGALAAIQIALFRPVFLSLVALSCLDLRDCDNAETFLGEAETYMTAGGERWFEAELCRLRGELLRAKAAAGGEGEPEALFRRAMAIARAHDARVLELRAATSLVRCAQSHPARDDARSTLRTLLDGMTEGFENPDLVDARAVLDGQHAVP